MIKRGDIYFIRDTRQSIGSEQKADRPAVIVSNDANNKHSGVYEVVYMTTQPKTDLPTHFITSSALRTSTVLCEQISSVYEERIGEWIGTLTPEEMKQLDECLTVSVGAIMGGRNGILQPAVQQKNKNKRRSNCMGAKMLQRGNRGGGSSWLCLYPPEQIRSCFTITF